MTTVKVAEGQTIWDLGMQYYGSVEGAGQLFHDNPAVSFDTDLEAGQELLINEEIVVDKSVLDTIKKEAIQINTGSNE
ncbi:MAG: hypothetical protein RIE86_09095 [Imperialibacter sp.]|uniref:hypothetical protein n=1 Tax=Imperialibacter sp. TaxID=2038411 RepID=UPI0032EF0403